MGAVILALEKKRNYWPGLAILTLSVVSIVITLTGVYRIRIPVSETSGKVMYSMLSNPKEQAEIIDSQWSAFGRTDLVRSALTPNEMYLFVDGAAGTSMYDLDALLADSQERDHLVYHYG